MFTALKPSSGTRFAKNNLAPAATKTLLPHLYRAAIPLTNLPVCVPQAGSAPAGECKTHSPRQYPFLSV